MDLCRFDEAHHGATERWYESYVESMGEESEGGWIPFGNKSNNENGRSRDDIPFLR